jgi:peroxiredoxin
VKKKFLVGALITVLLVISGFVLVKSLERKKAVRSNEWPPHLAVGETIDYFDLIELDGNPIDASVLKTKKPTLIFLFPRSNAPYRTDLSFWSRMVSIIQNKAQIFGIVLGTSEEARKIPGNTEMPFKLYYPANLDMFLDNMKIKSIFGQTLLCTRGEVEMVHAGEMNPEAYTGFLRKTIALARTVK